MIAEMGTGKTLMAMSIAHVYRGRTTVRLPLRRAPAIAAKDCERNLQTIPGARVYVIDSLRSQRPRQAGPQGVNELRFGTAELSVTVFTPALTDMRLRGSTVRMSWDRWVARARARATLS